MSKYRTKTSKKFIRYIPAYIIKYEIDGKTVLRAKKKERSWETDYPMIYRDLDKAKSVARYYRNYRGKEIDRAHVYKAHVNLATGDIAPNMDKMATFAPKMVKR